MVMLEGEITNEIEGGKVIYPSMIAPGKVWGRGRKYVGYQKVIQRSRPLAMGCQLEACNRD